MTTPTPSGDGSPPGSSDLVPPSYPEMIVAAITALAEENGSSQAAIARRIEAQARGDLPASHPALVAAHLSRMSAAGELVAVAGGKYALPPPPAQPAPESPADDGEDDDCADEVDEEEEAPEPLPVPVPQPPAKRGRGRPPKPRTADLRCIANTPLDEESALSQMVTCIEDLQEIVNCRKHESLTVQTFGTRIEKLHREKYLQLCDSVDMDKVDSTSTIMDEEDDVVRSLRASPVHPIKDRTSIDDFEIIKPISRGAFGRVFLAKKRTTGDLFAIKVLRKADMIRKNAVESILAERDILITVRNPFVVRFFYSFTSRDNLYLVMEYLNGGDLYSLLRNLGCLDEDVVRVYLAEVVLALEYLHSMHIVHRDLKPDNLLIAHDGHIKVWRHAQCTYLLNLLSLLTGFGLSKVGLINNTYDLSRPVVSGASLYGDDEPQMNEFEQMDHRARRQNRSAVGTPDYLAPEIILGTGHGCSADWWSVGVILFELIVGIPPFNAEHPQTIFDNILNYKIPWPHVPEEMSFDAQDLIDKANVKQHPFFKDISWDTLARQKAAFVPSSDNAFDTSYFTSRYSWNPSDGNIYEAYEFEDSSDNGSLSGSSSCLSNRQDDMTEDSDGLNEFESSANVNYSFSNFSFKIKV
ncbi:putative serine/threonine protein kinase IREH1 [Zea mays]|uniref:non-specific serine/threonine protein kinase n=1 Tax=Zea mays TaxID=4577 RepID=A0A1D6GJ95_MAIZE|nr:putative serine/threonine protein kinase IREH1 [Zea mays]